MKSGRLGLTLVLFAVIAVGAQAGSSSGSSAGAQDADCGGESCRAVLRGLFSFVDRHPQESNGNGRACADCHMPGTGFQLSPASAEARYQHLQLRRQRNRFADDPLFRPIDADDFRTQGDRAANFSNLRENGLIRISFQLPTNIKLIDPATNAVSELAFVDVWRAVPSVMNVKLTGPDDTNPWARGPNASGGYQLDARIGTLQEQAAAALHNHAEIAAAAPDQLLNDLGAFQDFLFSSSRVRELAEALRTGTTPLPDGDPPLNALEMQGKAVFARACAQCHGGPGGSTPQPPVVRFHDISTQCPRPIDTVVPARWDFKPCPARLERNANTYAITLADGSVTLRTSSDPGRALLTGFVGGPAARDDWNKFDIPGLHGIAKTPPYFHNNSATTLEEVVAHYTEFFKRVQVLAPSNVPLPPVISSDGINVDRPPSPADVPALLAYLRKL